MVNIARGESPPRIKDGVLKDATVMGLKGGYSVSPDLGQVNPLPGGAAVISSVGEPFDLAGFNVTRTPLVIGQADLEGLEVGTNINSLPIKFPGTSYRIPAELSCLASLLSMCISYEHAINPRVFEDYYAHLSVQRSYVRKGIRQRSGEIHCDGIQGARIQPKQPIEHGYVMVDRDPTVFYPGPIDLTDLDVGVHDICLAFEQRVDKKNRLSIPVGTVALIDGYCIHEAVPATASGPRGFFRLLFATRPYDRLGNSINNLFEDEYRNTGWEFAPRPYPSGLLPPPEN